MQEMIMPLLDLVYRYVLLAQAQNKSFIYGYNYPGGNSAAGQITWEYLTYESDGMPVYSTLRFSTSDMVLLRSETLPAHRVPASFNNETCPGVQPLVLK
jgi:hypothetical protein